MKKMDRKSTLKKYSLKEIFESFLHFNKCIICGDTYDIVEQNADDIQCGKCNTHLQSKKFKKWLKQYQLECDKAHKKTKRNLITKWIKKVLFINKN